MPARDIAITLRANTSLTRVGEPITCGVPFPRGLLTDATTLQMIGPDGSPTPLQVRVLDRWADQSARWVLCDWRATGSGTIGYRLRLDSGPSLTPPLRFGEGLGGRGQSRDAANANLSPPTPLSEAERGENTSTKPNTEDAVRRIVDDIGSRYLASDGFRLVSEGQHHTALPDFDWFVEDAGPLRTSILERGCFTHEGVNLARYALRTHHFANSPVVRVHFTITNPNRAEHPGGLWDLGDSGSIYIERLSFWLPVLAERPPTIRRVSPEVGKPFEPFQAVVLNQISSGGENWQSSNHVSKLGIVSLTIRGYSLQHHQSEERLGQRATPIISYESNEFSLAVSVPEFWQNFPKRLEASPVEVGLDLMPVNPEPQELQGGEQKEHVFCVAFGRDTITPDPLEWTRDPLIPVVDPEWIASTNAIPYFSSQAADPHQRYQQLANAAIDGDDTFEKKREIIDEYGWRHFGDIYGDHEAILHTEHGPKPRISHYNNQYDAIAGFAIHWLRSGDPRWFRQMNELASHVRDIDIYNTDEDKAAYNHGLFWHTYHYVDAGTGTHRSYPKAGRVPPNNKPVPGGGPGSEQNYAHGLMLHYFLTGDEASKEAAVGLAQWVIDMDDGRKTVFRWLTSAASGLASASRSPDYHGPGRGAANSVAALLDGHQLTHEPKFLKKAEQLIRRVIHPTDDATKMVGMIRDGKIYVDAENRWFYVMFLVSLGKYLDRKAELGEFDEPYAFARASLLHYARWMAEHEYPYLDRPETLEYPTETWAAQDMWKSEVFDFASLHAEGEERRRFRERAEYFFRASTEKLATMPTRTLCRPVVLMLSHGWRRAWFAAHPESTHHAPRDEFQFAPRVPFVPQKAIAMKRAKLFAACGVAFGFVATIALLIWLAT